VSELARLYPDAELLVVDDGSTDDTARLARAAGARVISHPYSKGNGAAIKTGARAATRAIVVFMDADGQHLPAEVAGLVAQLREREFDMVVGARDAAGQATVGRHAANTVFNRFATWMVGHRIEDLTSGFRAVRRDLFNEFLYLLPNGFSYPTTSTMAFFRSGYSVGYRLVTVMPRRGKSHISSLRDGLKFLLIIFRVGTLYSPLRVYFPVSGLLLLLGLGYYCYTFWTQARFTNMSALLLTGSLITFLFGLISEQITALIYKRDHP
jgi:glycosyltransferase involved in cell wall biosynthesis